MIDWHCHVLPGVDDGSRDTAESVSLINMQAEQGVDTVIATPHFYANDETVGSFLYRREKALERLKGALRSDSPRIRVGAEVKYYHGISRLEYLKALRIEKSKLLLLEMPMSSWTEYMVRELEELSGKNGIKLVLAHIERYLNLQSQAVWDRLQSSGILMQVNASFFTEFASKRKAISLLSEGMIHFVGSDCHGLTHRPPQIGKAFEIIQKKMGDEFTRQMDEFGHSVLTVKRN